MDNLKELQKKYEDLGAEIERLKQSKDGKLNIGDAYFYITERGALSAEVWEDDFFEKRRLSIGNVFPTKEEAERHVEKLRLIQDLKSFAQGFKPDWGDYKQDKYYLFYDYNNKKWEWGYDMGCQFIFGLPHFATKERAEEAIEHFGDKLNVLLD